MCCFSRAVRFVGGTKIFARGLSDGRQLLVYTMNVELDQELAMILPLPVPPCPDDDAVSFVDLQHDAGFFTELAEAFPPAYAAQPAKRSFGPAEKPKLVVHDVGDYEASFVPTAGDFTRLDERFRLPTGFLGALPAYADYGFAVFRLKPQLGLFGRTKKQSVHPMAFSFPRRESRSLFFPTVHVHDGSLPLEANFDHALYCQVDGVLEATLGWTASHDALDAHVRPKAPGLIEPARGGFMTALWGSLRNADLWLREPPGVTPEMLRGAGEGYAFEVRATAAHAFGFQGERQAWADTASQRLAVLCRGLTSGLAELTAARRGAWQLAPLAPALPPHFMNGPKLWSGTSYMNGAPATSQGPGRVHFRPFTQRVEPQDVTLAFAQLPTQEAAVAINAALAHLLERIAS
jgi:hypothetical protein